MVRAGRVFRAVRFGAGWRRGRTRAACLRGGTLLCSARIGCQPSRPPLVLIGPRGAHPSTPYRQPLLLIVRVHDFDVNGQQLASAHRHQRFRAGPGFPDFRRGEGILRAAIGLKSLSLPKTSSGPGSYWSGQTCGHDRHPLGRLFNSPGTARPYFSNSPNLSNSLPRAAKAVYSRIARAVPDVTLFET